MLERLVAAGLPHATAPDGAPRFDPAEAVNAMIARGLAGEERFWRERYVATGRALAGAFDAAPADLPPRRFAVEWWRGFALAGATPGARLRLPLPIVDAHLSALEVEALADVALAVDAERIEARVPSPAPGWLTIGARLRFTAHAGTPHGGAPSPAERDLWLRPREGAIAVTPRVAALGERLAAGIAAPGRAVEAFRRHILDTMACGMLPARRAAPSPDAPLDGGWFDCRSGAALLVSLCRARGIPARLVGGHLLSPRAPTEHWWAEAWLGAWTPVDLLAWDLSAGGADAGWRDYYARGLDYRMKTQILPRRFDASPGLARPEAWHRLTRATPRGIATTLVALDGHVFQHDELAVMMLEE